MGRTINKSLRRATHREWFAEAWNLEVRGKAEMVWTCTEEGCWIYKTKITMELAGKSKREKFHGCNEGEHAEGWYDRRGC